MKPNKANIRKWVKALRSGKYKQAKKKLRDGDRFCCLGVACDISGLADWEGETYLGEDLSLPIGVMEWLGVDQNEVTLPKKYRYATVANDKGKRFSTIANLIEKEYLK